MSAHHSTPKTHGDSHRIPYVIGFTLSLLLTGAAFLAVMQLSLPRGLAIGVIVTLAIIQLLVQFIFFLHLHEEQKPRWNLLVFLFMLCIVLIIVTGSLWIMHHLDYNMMPPVELNEHIRQDEGIKL